MKKRKIIRSIIIAILIIGGVYICKIYENDNSYYGIVEAQEKEIAIESNRREMINNATKSVVGVSKLKNIGNSIFQNDGTEQVGIGSGIIILENGYVLTNEHVSGGKGSNCYITVEDGKQYTGKVIWSDDNLDLAIIKANMKFIDVCKLGDSDDIGVGENVFAIGNPVGFEFQKTVTSGIISALDRTIKFNEGEKEIYYSNLIQTDAIINPGNSGGPLINENGEVVGITTVKLTSAYGIGFAIPINIIKPIVDKLEKEGKFDEPQIGIFAYDKNVIPYLDNKLSFDNGIYIAQISLDSPAYRSGLQIGDVITRINDVELERMCDLRKYIYGKNVGDKVSLFIIRNRKNIEIEVELTKKI